MIICSYSHGPRTEVYCFRLNVTEYIEIGLFFVFFVILRVAVAKYLGIFHLGVGESTGLSKANWIICGRYPESSTGRQG